MAKIQRLRAATLESKKGADWKVEIVRVLREQTTASNVWLAERLHMGHPNRISNALKKQKKLEICV